MGDSFCSGFCLFIRDTNNDLKASTAFDKGEQGFILASSFTNDAIQFPVTEGGPGVDMMRAAFDGFALRRTGSGADMGFCLLLLWLLREVLIGDIGDITAFDVAVEGGGGNGPFTGPASRLGPLLFSGGRHNPEQSEPSSGEGALWSQPPYEGIGRAGLHCRWRREQSQFDGQ